MIEVQVSLARALLNDLALRLRPNILLKLIGLRMTEFVTGQFETRSGGRWAPLAPSTLALRKRGGDAPLQDTGGYRQSFLGQPPKTDNATFVEIGSADYRAEWHEFGTRPFTIPATKKVKAALARSGEWIHFGKKEIHHPGIPARPVLPNKRVLEILVQSEIEGYLEQLRVGG